MDRTKVKRIAALLLAALWLAPALHAQRFQNEIAAFERSDKTNPPPQHAILFIGSSSIRKWTNLARDFPNHQVINRGFGGSYMSESVRYFDRIVLPYHPALIVIYAGANDINAGQSPEKVCSDFKAFVKKAHDQLPGTRVDFISIGAAPSRKADIPRVEEANRLVRDYIKTDPALSYIDVFTAMLHFSSDYYVRDRLHMSGKGYAVWRSIIAPYLDQ